jgi:uncharacterized protein (TIGR02145 family)
MRIRSESRSDLNSIRGRSLWRVIVVVCVTLVHLEHGDAVSAQTTYVDSWNPDANGNNQVDVIDLVALLSVFQDRDIDLDGIWDGSDLCTDTMACNFSANPSVECTFLDAIGVCGGWCDEDLDSDGICDWVCGIDAISYNGYAYPTVQIGGQCWFSENLRTLQFKNLELIPYNLNDEQWASTDFPACCSYDYEELDNSDAGVLYNYFAVASELGLCPSGWHVPSDEEFIQLESFLDLPIDDWYDVGVRGIQQEVGFALKDSVGFNGTNSSGFKVVSSGYRMSDGNFHNGANAALIWSSTPSGQAAFARSLCSNSYNSIDANPGVGRVHGGWNNFFGLGVNQHPNHGMSVRCLKDE